jgi:PilZ domain
MVRNKRQEERVSRALPVKLGDADGTTLDVSATGVFFETNASLNVGNSVDFTVEFDSPNGKMVLNCVGTVVRVEPRDLRLGIAVKISESRMGRAS